MSLIGGDLGWLSVRVGIEFFFPTNKHSAPESFWNFSHGHQRSGNSAMSVSSFILGWFGVKRHCFGFFIFRFSVWGAYHLVVVSDT